MQDEFDFRITQIVAIFIIWLLNGWFPSFGAPCMVKVNAPWFHRTGRGTFTGICGFMIQLGCLVG